MSVCLLVTIMNCAKTAAPEPTEIPFGLWISVGQRTVYLVWPGFPGEGPKFCGDDPTHYEVENPLSAKVIRYSLAAAVMRPFAVVTAAACYAFLSRRNVVI